MKHFDVYRIISASLRTGVILSMASIISGVVIIMIKGGADGYTLAQIASYSKAQTLYSSLIPLNNLFTGMYQLDGAFYVAFGLWVLIFTPITVVVIALISFIETRNRLYIALSSCVLFVLFFAMLVVPHFLS